ncbi:MAG: type VI secretion system ImpA family N-terminal domain-containing protein [Geminicoccaceae bacterium]
MEPALTQLLEPLGGELPCGPDARDLDSFSNLRTQVDQLDKPAVGEQPTRVDWARQRDRILELARQTRDLRVWVWLAQSQLATEGLTGFASAMELLAAGLERYWDQLPPYDDEDYNPRERFTARLGALGGLACSNYQTTAVDLLKRRSTLLFLEEFDRAVAMAAGSPDGPAAAQRLEAVFAALETLFRERYGTAGDPQLGFGELVRRLRPLQGGAEPQEAVAPDAAPAARANGHAKVGVQSREDVVAALDRVLDYYSRNEPSSPVPLLVGRAKRLVSMTFLDAIKELAPGGLKELQAVAGADDAKTNR